VKHKTKGACNNRTIVDTIDLSSNSDSPRSITTCWLLTLFYLAIYSVQLSSRVTKNDSSATSDQKCTFFKIHNFQTVIARRLLFFMDVKLLVLYF